MAFNLKKLMDWLSGYLPSSLSSSRTSPPHKTPDPTGGPPLAQAGGGTRPLEQPPAAPAGLQNERNQQVPEQGAEILQAAALDIHNNGAAEQGRDVPMLENAANDAMEEDAAEN
ncbi:hypothetical protein ZWY2020_035465 [Hordeum vulgare]|nr:hypothetical protein ZWY2020_035465 [Hordeum vulgare]